MNQHSKSQTTPVASARRKWLAVLGAAAALASAWAMPGVAHASAYPDRPIKLVLPFGAGSSDALARVIGQKVSTALGQPVIIENRPGAGAVIGTDFVARSQPDGYTLLFLGGGSLTPVLVKDLKVDFKQQFRPVMALGRGGMMVMVSADTPVNNLRELIEYSRKNPGKLNFGYAATSARVAGEVLNAVGPMSATTVPYKGSSAVLTALIANEVQITADVPVQFMPMIKEGKIRPIVYGGSERSPILPDVPTLAGAGFPGVVFPASFGVWAPKDVPDEVVAKLNAAFNTALRDPDVISLLKLASMVPTGGAPEVHSRQIESEHRGWADAAKKVGFEPQ